MLGHREIQGNEHADRLAKAGLRRQAKDPLTSLSYLKRKAKEEILARWKQEWKLFLLYLADIDRLKVYFNITTDKLI